MTQTKILKRNGTVELFDCTKILNAVKRCFVASGYDTIPEDFQYELADLIKEITCIDSINVENIQDKIENALMDNIYNEVAKNYIIYRYKRTQRRDLRKHITSMFNGYLDKETWEVKENSNTSYSFQGLNHHIQGDFSKIYWRTEVYDNEINESIDKNYIHIHDLSYLSAYCCGWDIKDLLINGLGGVENKTESKPPKHLQSALSQLANFLYMLQGENAGAQAVSSLDTYMAPFIRSDKLTKKEVKSAVRQFVFNLNLALRSGFQCTFSNVTLDLVADESAIKNDPVIINGQLTDNVYSEFQKEMDIFNIAFLEVMSEGDKKGRLFSFPIPTYNITKNFDWNRPVANKLFEVTAKYGIPYFSNYINSTMSPDDARSMCCRLRLDNRELRKRGGGLFGANPLTGSIGVVTLNLPKIAYKSKNRKHFFNLLERNMDVAKKSLEVKRTFVEQWMENDLYPYSKFFLRQTKEVTGKYYSNHFSTIGLIGSHECCLNFLGEGIETKNGKKFIEEVLDFMRNKMQDYQEETGNLYNLEATPAEGTSYRLAKIDKERYSDIITSGDDEPYYTNSSQLPVNYSNDIFDTIEHQDSLQTKYTGGTVIHLYNNELGIDSDMVKMTIKKICENYEMPYISWTPIFSICSDHGYIQGEFHNCPTCNKETEVYLRVVGFYRPLSAFNNGKKEEHSQRVTYKIKK